MDKEIKLSKLIVGAYSYLFTNYTARLVYMFGSRKSAKTKHIALRLVLRAMQDPDYNALGIRKDSARLEESIMEEIQWAIQILGVGKLWEYKISKRTFTFLPYNNKIVLRGITINSETGKPTLSGLGLRKGWFKDCWLEEAWELRYDDYKMIRQTMRGGLYSMLIVGNPYFAVHWAVNGASKLLDPDLQILKDKGEMYAHFPKSDDNMESIVHWSNFQINDKLSEYDLEERWEEQREDPKSFEVTGYGYPGAPAGSILGYVADKVKYVPYTYFFNQITEYRGGVDVGLERDATAAVFGGYTQGYENMVLADEYYHSNGDRDCNKNSNNGVWTQKTPDEYADELLAFYLLYRDTWIKRGRLKVDVDHADSAFISTLNTRAKELGMSDDIIFLKCEKPTIESRIIFEKQMISRGRVLFVEDEIDKIKYKEMTQLMYEIENLPWKITMTSGQPSAKRDDSKVPDHITNAWEYFFTKRMNQMQQWKRRD